MSTPVFVNPSLWSSYLPQFFQGGQLPTGTGFPGGPPIPAPPERSINWGEALKAGQSADYFGHADYSEALSRGASRQQILRYLDANPGKLREQNVKGGGGLYDQIQREGAAAIGTHYGDYTLEGRKDHFGAADYAGSRAAGATDLQIKNWLEQNPGTLRGGNTFESLKAGYAGGFHGSGTTGSGGAWQPFTSEQMNQYNQQWQQSMNDYNQQMQNYMNKLEEKRNEVTHTGTKDVEQGKVTSVAQAPGTFGSGGQGTANWTRPRRLTKTPGGIQELTANLVRTGQLHGTGLNIK